MRIRIHYIPLLLLFLLRVSYTNAQYRISIFYDHVAEIARQQHISIKAAAERVRQIGYNGIDVRVGMKEEELSLLDSLGFQHACAIADINLIAGDQPAVIRQVLDFMHHHQYTRLLLLPGFLPEQADAEYIDAACTRIAAFARSARMEGITVMVEDFDNPRAICYNTPILNHLFAASPQLDHVFDTGNYPFCGEDVMVALRHFRQRVAHVHLKDRRALRHSESLVIGTGILPLKDVIGQLLSSGYDGWFTVEHFGAPDMLRYAEQSYANVKSAWDAVAR